MATKRIQKIPTDIHMISSAIKLYLNDNCLPVAKATVALSSFCDKSV